MDDSDKSEDEDVIYEPSGARSHDQSKGLISGGSKNMDELLDYGPTDQRRLKKTIALCGAFVGLVRINTLKKQNRSIPLKLVAQTAFCRFWSYSRMYYS